MGSEQSTVELPANPDIKQLAHDVAREENEYCVPVLLGIYEHLSAFKEDRPIPLHELDLDVDDTLPSRTTMNGLVEALEYEGLFEKRELEGGRDGYVLNREE